MNLVLGRAWRRATPSMSIRTTLWLALGLLALVVLNASSVGAATNTGTALQPAFTALNDLVGGYGKQVLMLICFIATCFGVLASQATGAILKFIGFALFLGVGLGGALTIVGAVI